MLFGIGSPGMSGAISGGPQALQLAYLRDPRLALAAQLARQGSDTSPVQSPLQGVARVAQGLLSGIQANRVRGEYEKQAEEYANERRDLYAPVMEQGASGFGPRADARMRPATPEELLARAQNLRSPFLQDDVRQIQTMANQAVQDRAKFERDLAARREDRQLQNDFLAAQSREGQAFRAQEAQAARQQAQALADLQRRTTLEAAQLRAGNRSDPLVEVNDPNSPTGIRLVPQSQAAGMAAPAPRGTTAPTANISPEEQRNLGQQLGVPIMPVDPSATLGPAAAATFQREQQKQTERQLAEMREAVAAGRGSMADLRRFEELQGQQRTGGILGIPGVGAVARSVMAPFDPQLREMSSIADKITPSMRQPGSGATSDFDARMFQNATVGIDKPAETNRAIIAAARAAQQNQADRLAFMEAYATANRGSLRGAEDQWQRYLDANPIFDPSKPDTPTINQNRRPWADFFRSGGAQAPAQGQGGGGWSAREIR